jgi:hypothetical protein
VLDERGMGTRLHVNAVFRGEWEEKVAGWSEEQCREFLRRMRGYPEEAWTVKVRWVYGLVKRREARAREQEGVRTYWEDRVREEGMEAVKEERGRQQWEKPRWAEERAEREREWRRMSAEEMERMGRSWSKPRL